MLTHLCVSQNRVFAYNDRTAVVVGGLDTGLSCAIPGAVLLAILAGCSAEISLEQREAEVVIKDKGSVIKLPILSAEDFAYDPDHKEKRAQICELTPAVIVALELAAVNSNAESVRENLSGVTVLSKGSNLILYGTDNLTCTKITVPIGRREGATPAFILPKESCEILVKTYAASAEDSNKSSLSVGATSALAVVGTVRVDAKLVADSPADYEKILTDNKKGAAWSECPESLFAAAKRAAILTANDPEKLVTIEPLDGVLAVSARGGLGELQTKIKVKGVSKGEPYSVQPEALVRAEAWATEIGLGAPSLLLRGGPEEYSVEYVISKRG